MKRIIILFFLCCTIPLIAQHTDPIQEAMASFRAEVPSYDPEFYLENEIYQGIIYSDTSFLL